MTAVDKLDAISAKFEEVMGKAIKLRTTLNSLPSSALRLHLMVPNAAQDCYCVAVIPQGTGVMITGRGKTIEEAIADFNRKQEANQ